MHKTTFARIFGNRGFFPASLIAGAREELVRELHALGHNVLMLRKSGHRHHVSITQGCVQAPLHEALGHYLDFDLNIPQNLHR